MKTRIKKKQVKKKVKECYILCDKSLTAKMVQKQILAQELQEAFEKQQFVVYLQPKIVLAIEKIRDSEALVRWIHPKKGIIVPDQFISVLEENGEIKKLDFYVLERVCMILEQWKNETRKLHPISVNLSKVYLREKSLISEILEILDKYQISPNLIQFEITESVSLDGGEDVIKVIYKLKEKGFTIAIAYRGICMLSQCVLVTMRNLT